jgi:prepilin peptidase CpaA
LLTENAWWLLFAAFNVCVAICDLRWRRVPNVLLLAVLTMQLAWLVALRFGLAAAQPFGAGSWTDALGGFSLGLLFFPFWK